MRIEIVPLDKVVLDNFEIKFGMKKSEVELGIGPGSSIGNRCYYFDNEMAIEYDHDYKVLFLEFLGGIDGKLKPELFGVSVFESIAEEFLSLLIKACNGDFNDTERGYFYSFPQLGLGIYRERCPNDIEELLEEMNNNGYNHDDIIKEELKKAQYWATIGCGTSNYYN